MRKRKPSTRFVLVKWVALDDSNNQHITHTIEAKAHMHDYWKWEIKKGTVVILCDDQPLGMLKSMLKLLEDDSEKT